jgi:pilus assembly protein CpaE
MQASRVHAPCAFACRRRFRSGFPRVARIYTVAHGLPFDRAMIVTFLGTKGGTGTTTLAVNCAAELRRLSNNCPTLIADVKAGPGDVALFLGLRARYSIVDLVDQLGWTDRALATRFVCEHQSGLHVLAASDAFGRPASRDAERVEQALRAYAGWYEHVIVDAGSTVNASAAAALAISDVVMLVAHPDLPCLRNLQRYGDALRLASVAPERVRVVLNRVSDSEALPVGQIERVLSRRIDYQLPNDPRTVTAALNNAAPIASVKPTDLHEQITEMARSLAGPPLAASA